MTEPQDSIMDMVNNVEPLYNDKMAMFDNWVEEGDVWNERTAEREALDLAGNFAESIESIEYIEGKYKRSSVEEAAGEMMEEFEEYRDEAIKKGETITFLVFGELTLRVMPFRDMFQGGYLFCQT